MSYTFTKVSDGNLSHTKSSGFTLTKNLKVGDKIMVYIDSSDSDDEPYDDLFRIISVIKRDNFITLELDSFGHYDLTIEYTHDGKYIKRIRG